MTCAARIGNIEDGVLDGQKVGPPWFGSRGPGQQELEIEKVVSWIAGELELWVWKEETWAERVGKREDGVLDGRKVGPLDFEEGDLGRKSW